MTQKTMVILLLSLSISSCGYVRHVRFPRESTIHPMRINIEASEGYRAGVAKAIVTPAHDTWLAGFMPWRKAEGAHDDLEVRTLAVIDSGGHAYIFVTVDLIGFMHNDVEVLRNKIDIPNIEIFVLSSHTHAGPDTAGFWGALPITSGRDENYIDEIIDVMAKTVVDSLKNAQQADIYSSSIIADGMTKNIRESFLDNELSVLVFHNPQIGHIALLANFGCHPEVLKKDNHLISSDFVGAMRDYVDKELYTTTLFVNGALGGMVQPNMKWDNNETFEKRDAFGRALGKTILLAVSKIFINNNAHVVPIKHRRSIIHLPLTNKYFLGAALIGLIPHRGVFLSGGYLTTEVNVIKIDEITIVMIPGEIVPELELEIKKIGGSGTQVWSLANDELGYILNKAKFSTKTFKYEHTMSVGPDTGPIIMNAVKALLSETAIQN